MICIYCFHSKTQITNSRGHKKEASTWRRHACTECGRVYTSLERPVMSGSYRITNEVKESDEPYSRSRLTHSLTKAFGHITGSELYTSIDALADTVERNLITAAYYGVLSKDELGAIAWDVVKNYDPVAGVQYAAQNGLISAVKKRPGRPSLE